MKVPEFDSYTRAEIASANPPSVAAEEGELSSQTGIDGTLRMGGLPATWVHFRSSSLFAREASSRMLFD